MTKQQIWKETTKNLMSPNCRSMKCKWFFKIKCNSVCSAQLVACVYSQAQGINFLENYDPVILIKFGLLLKIVNIKTAILYQEFEEEIYIERPLGMKNILKNSCIILRKYIYGLVQAARQHKKKAKEILKKVGFS